MRLRVARCPHCACNGCDCPSVDWAATPNCLPEHARQAGRIGGGWFCRGCVDEWQRAFASGRKLVVQD